MGTSINYRSVTRRGPRKGNQMEINTAAELASKVDIHMMFDLNLKLYVLYYADVMTYLSAADLIRFEESDFRELLKDFVSSYDRELSKFGVTLH